MNKLMELNQCVWIAKMKIQHWKVCVKFTIVAVFIFCWNLISLVSISKYSRTSSNSHLSTMATILSQRTVHTLTLIINLSTTATSPQWQQPLKHVPNCKNNLMTMASFLQRLRWKSQEWWSNLIDMACWRLIVTIVFLLCLIYTAAVSIKMPMILKVNVANLSHFITLTFWFKT